MAQTGNAGDLLKPVDTLAYGGSAKEAGLDGHIIQPKKLQELAAKK